MTFGSALAFFAMGEAGQRIRQAWLGGMAGAEHDSRPRERRLQPTLRVRRPVRREASRAMARLPTIAEWNARLPSVARQDQSCPLTVYAGVVGQGPSVWQDSNAPWRNPARPSDNRAAGPISRGIRPVTNCIESEDAASMT